MKTLPSVLILALPCGACTVESHAERDDVGLPTDGGESPEDAPAVTSALQARELTCVSEASLGDDELVSSVWRVNASVRAGTSQLALWRGPQFASHAGSWSAAGEVVATNDAVATEEEGSFRLDAVADAPLGLRLERRGHFFEGELDRDGAADSMLCWDTLELFGSSWAQQPSSLPARYDPTLGACVDSAGVSALNELPLAFVRETSFGECADLRGAALNDQDLDYPDLYLSLRGAKLDGATLHFAQLSASLEGARLRKFVFGYATISGRVDDSTELPIGTACNVVESTWAGNQVTCRQ